MAKKAQTLTATVTLFGAGTSYLTGELLAQENGTATVKYKKPRSSKYAIRSIPARDLLYVWQGEEDQEVAFRDRVEVASFTGEVTHNEDGTITVTDEDGVVTTIGAGADVEIYTDVEDEPKSKKGKKDEKAKVSKKSKKDEDEDEDEDDEDDDYDVDVEEDEEDEPKAKKGKKGKKAGKKQAQADVNNDDDDEDW